MRVWDLLGGFRRAFGGATAAAIILTACRGIAWGCVSRGAVTRRLPASAPAARFGRVFSGFNDPGGFAAAGVVDHIVEGVLRAAVASGLIAGLCLTLALLIAAVLLTIAALGVLGLLLLAPRVHFALRLAEQAGVMFGMLLKVLGGHPIIRELRIPGQLIVFIDNLLRCPAYFAFGPGTVEHPIDNIADGAIAIALGPRAVLR